MSIYIELTQTSEFQIKSNGEIHFNKAGRRGVIAVIQNANIHRLAGALHKFARNNSTTKITEKEILSKLKEF